MGSLTCTTILVCAVHTVAKQMLMSLHKCWLRRTEKWPFWRWIYSQPWTPTSFSPRSRPADLRQLKLTLYSVCFSVCFERGEDVDGTHAEGIAQLCWVDCSSVCAATPQILRCVWLVSTSVDAATCVLKCNYTSLYSLSQGNCLMHKSFEAVCAQTLSWPLPRFLCMITMMLKRQNGSTLIHTCYYGWAGSVCNAVVHFQPSSTLCRV